MVSYIRATLFDFTITIAMSGLAEVTRISGGIVAGGLSEALWLRGLHTDFHLSLSRFYVVDYFLKDTVMMSASV